MRSVEGEQKGSPLWKVIGCAIQDDPDNSQKHGAGQFLVHSIEPGALQASLAGGGLDNTCKIL